MRSPSATLTLAGNGHLWLCFEQASPWLALRLRLRLQLVHGFQRDGPRVAGFDEIIVPDFVRGQTRLLAGWDHWSGLYLLSDSAAGDDFLRTFAARYV